MALDWEKLIDEADAGPQEPPAQAATVAPQGGALDWDMTSARALDSRPAATGMGPRGGGLDEAVQEYKLLDLIRKDTGEQGRESGEYIGFAGECPVCHRHDCFRFYPQTNSWKCFGANGDVGGTAVDYLMHAHDMTKTQAIGRVRTETGHALRTGAGQNAASAPVDGAPQPMPTLEIKKGGFMNPVPRAPVLIDGLLREGHKLLITAPAKFGKSLLLMQLAICVATGRKWIGCRCERRDVLYIDPELDPPSFTNRMHDLAVRIDGSDSTATLQYIDEHISHMHLRGQVVTMTELTGYICQTVKKGTYGLVVLDSVVKVFEGDENAASDVNRFYAMVDRIAGATGAAFAISHHTAKGADGSRATTETGRGSSVWGTDPDAPTSLVELFPPKDDDNRLMDSNGKPARAFQFRADGLREFPGKPPTNVYLDYPIFKVDDGGMTDGWTPRCAQSRGGTASGETRAGKAESNANAAALAVMRLITANGGEPVTKTEAVRAVIEKTGVSESTAWAYIEKSGEFEITHPRANRTLVGLRADGDPASDAQAGEPTTSNELDSTSLGVA